MTKHDYNVRMLCDSVAPGGERLSTLELTYPRIVHAEFMTHRLLCLAGDSELEFEPPVGQRRDLCQPYQMRLDEFVSRWIHGRHQPQPSDISHIEPSMWYSVAQIANRFRGLTDAQTLNRLCSRGELTARRSLDARAWEVRGSSLIVWLEGTPDARYDVQLEVRNLRIRQMNEDTGQIQWSYVVNVSESGRKRVYELVAGGHRVAGSAEHRVMTLDGWKRIGDITPGLDSVIVRRESPGREDASDLMRRKTLAGGWLIAQQKRLRDDGMMCRRCLTQLGTVVHHIIPVHMDPTRALDAANVTLLCGRCHLERGVKHRRDEGPYLHTGPVLVDAITERGVEPTYDLEIAGRYPNFLANGVVVHNSRNAASSRAIPTPHVLEMVRDSPMLPKWWGRNQAGMQASEQLTGEDLDRTLAEWRDLMEINTQYAERWHSRGLHKQIVNRIIEPWLFITVIASATEWGNFLHLRDTWPDPDQPPGPAQPELAWLGREIRRVLAASTPRTVAAGEWHLPLVELHDETSAWYISLRERELLETDRPGRGLQAVSAARCARVSYLTHDGRRDLSNDLALHDRLVADGHWSPFEHVAQAMPDTRNHDLQTIGDSSGFVADHVRRGLAARRWSGNFRGWVQYRKLFVGEHIGYAPGDRTT